MREFTKDSNNTNAKKAQAANQGASFEPEPQEAPTNEEYEAVVKDAESETETYIEVNPSNIENQEFTTEVRVVPSMKDVNIDVNRGSATDNGLIQFIIRHPLIAACLLLGFIGAKVAATVSGVEISKRSKKIAEIETMLNANSSKYSSILNYNTTIEALNLATTDAEKAKLSKKLKTISKEIESGMLSNTARQKLIIKHAKLMKKSAKPMYYTNSPADSYGKESLKAHQKAVKLAAKAEGKKAKENAKAYNKYITKAEKQINAANLGSAPSGLHFPVSNEIDINGKTAPLYVHRSITNDAELNNTFDAINGKYTVSSPNIYVCRITMFDGRNSKDLECSFDNRSGYELAKALLYKQAKKLVDAEKYVSLTIKEFISDKKQTKTKVDHITLASKTDEDRFNELVNDAEKILTAFDKKLEQEKDLLTL